MAKNKKKEIKQAEKKVEKKVEEKVQEVKKDSKEIVIDLDAIAIPGAIIIAGLIIAGAILLTNRGGGNTNTGNIDTTNTDTQDQEFADATTNIGNSPYLGDKKKAKVALVEYTDFQCPYCARHATDTKPSIIKDYVDTGKIIYVVKNFPLDFHGQIAIDTANASLCVKEIGGNSKYFDFYAKGYSQKTTDDLANIVKGLGINMDKYNTCMAEKRYADQITQDTADGTKAGVQGTPGFVIGVLDKDGNVTGKLIAGAYPFESFQAIIDEMLKK